MAEEDPCRGTVEGEANAGPLKARWRGVRFIDMIIAVIILWAVVVKPMRDEERANLVLSAHTQEHTAIVAAQERMTESMSEFSYILALPQAERERLNLVMPYSLRRKIYDNAPETRSPPVKTPRPAGEAAPRPRAGDPS